MTRKPRKPAMPKRVIRIDDARHTLLKRLGNDNFSRGIRRITDERLGENGEAYFEPVKKANATDVVLLAGVNNVASGHKPESIIADLQTAWDAFHTAGVTRVISVKLTPWFGYEKFFGAGKKTAQPYRDATNAVNAYIDARSGQPGGPEAKVETSSLGDSNGALLKEYSAGGLHMNAAGRQALAALVAKVL